MNWPSIPPERRARVLNLLRLVANLGPMTTGPLQPKRDAEAAITALEDVAALQDLKAAEARIRREIAIAAADRCYQRAMSRVAQIDCAPHARDVLWLKAGEARAAGDDVLLAAGLKPAEHPRAEELRERRVP